MRDGEEAKVGQKGNNSRHLKDVAVNKKQNKMDVVVGNVPWHYQDSEKEDYKRYRAQGRHCGVVERTM
jgi:hypothetical protein